MKPRIGLQCASLLFLLLSMFSCTTRQAVDPKTNLAREQAYHLKAGGYGVLITNAPESNPVSISLVRQIDESVVFRLKNGEHHTILLWNVRVQVKSKDRGTDGFGWDTVTDEPPNWQSHFGAGMSGDFSVQHPQKSPWRVCIIYSTDWNDSGKKYSENYEVISQPLLQ